MNVSRAGLATAGTYLVLFLLGAVQGLAGSFQYSRNAPAGPILLALLIGGTCLLAGWGMRTPVGAFIPGLGWVMAAFVISMPRSNGSVIIASTHAGEWFLYGGMLAVVISVAISAVLWLSVSRSR